MSENGLRLMFFDQTCHGRGPLPGLTDTWRVGGWFYGQLGRLDAWSGASTWEEGLEWLASYQPEQPIREIQYWGHGNWGKLLMQRDPLDVSALEPSHRLHPLLLRVRERLVSRGEGDESGEGALLWFRTCETFGTETGHRFARAFADFFRATVAGHTYVIAWAQSGLHTLRPGEEPTWPADEGLGPDPKRARWSGFLKPNTISCLTGRIPPQF